MPYFNKLQQDMLDLGVVSDGRAPETYRQLVQLADAASGKENFDRSAVSSIDPAALRTNFARYALRLFEEDPLLASTDEVMREESEEKKYGICSRAEYMIATTMLPKSLRNETIASPIVITEDDSPVGVLQRSRNEHRSIYYALGESSLPASVGCIYQIPLGVDSYSSQLKSPSPWQMPADELEGRFDQGRLSVFTIPPFERQRLGVNMRLEAHGLQRSHQALVARARALMDFARPISVK